MENKYDQYLVHKFSFPKVLSRIENKTKSLKRCKLKIREFTKKQNYITKLDRSSSLSKNTKSNHTLNSSIKRKGIIGWKLKQIIVPQKKQRVSSPIKYSAPKNKTENDINSLRISSKRIPKASAAELASYANLYLNKIKVDCNIPAIPNKNAHEDANSEFNNLFSIFAPDLPSNRRKYNISVIKDQN